MAVRSAIDDFFAPVLSVDASDAFKMDVEDAGDKYVVTAQLPGVTKDQVDVELNEGRLSISWTRRSPTRRRTRTTCRRRPRSGRQAVACI
jgi:HSP20 family protein